MQNTSSLIKAFVGGLTISFLGSLAPGTMTITSVLIVSKQGITPGWFYSAGSVVAELIVVCLMLYAMSWLSKWRSLFFIFELLTALILAAMTVACFYAAQYPAGSSIIEWKYNFAPFISGFVLSILNPVHMTFWMGWSIVLMNKKMLQPASKNYFSYLIGIGIGSMLGYAVYIYGGNYILQSFSRNANMISLGAGIILLVVCIMQIRKMVLVPATVRYAGLFKETVDAHS